MIHIEDKVAEVRTGSVVIRPTEIPAGETVTLAIKLAIIDDLKPNDMVYPTYLLVPKSRNEYVSVIQVLGGKSDDDLMMESTASKDLPDENVYHLHPDALSPLEHIFVTVRNESVENQVFEASLTCQIKPVLGTWFGPASPAEPSSWRLELLYQLVSLLTDWRDARVARQKEQREMREHERTQNCFYNEDLQDELRVKSIRERLRLMIIDYLDVASFPVKAVLQLTTKTLQDLSDWQQPPKEPLGQTVLASPSVKIEAGHTALLTFAAQVPFRPVTIIIPAHLQAGILVSDIKVGKNSQLITPGAIPAAAFALTNGTPIALRMDTARPGMPITISIANTRDTPVEFEATLVGLWEQ